MKHLLIIPVIIVLLAQFSCKKEKFEESKDALLTFSTDTLMFDTVFTTIGSATKQFKVINTHSKPIKISAIYLAKSNNSPFRLNINGFSTRRLEDVVIEENDSLYIFVEVSIDPNNVNSPLVVQDSIVFEVNGNVQDIDLVAWGQDVHLINGEVIETDQIWTNDKPYLVYNSMLVDSGVTLTITAGTRLHFHYQSRLFVLGTMVVNGTLDEPVIFEGDRLEEWYNDIPGQWDGIYFLAGSKSNVMNYCEVKNAIIGIQADTMASLSDPTLRISNSLILNMNAAGIYGQGSTITASNCVVGNCGQYAIALAIGGEYYFYHCTVYNNWPFSNRQTPSILINNYYKDIYGTYQVRPLVNAVFGNCILYGNRENEIGIDAYPGSPVFNYKFDHCLLKIDPDISTTDLSHFEEIIKNTLPVFTNPEKEDYSLDTLCIAIDVGDFGIGGMYPLDFMTNNRLSDGKPDLGAYERQE
jgi:hypothetical protein